MSDSHVENPTAIGLCAGKLMMATGVAGPQRLVIQAVLRCLVVMLCCYPLQAQNLVPDPSFSRVQEFGGKANSTRWQWHRIEEPCQVRVEQGKATLQAGKVFLHSMEFAVEAGTIYDLQIEASGDAQFAGEILWWKQNGLPSRSHRSVVFKPGRLVSSAAKLGAAIRAPSDAATAYVRFVAESGRAILKTPLLQAAPGKLLLKLDAAAPGATPNEIWEDLTGANKGFALQSVIHSPKTLSYLFAEPGASCVGSRRDASRFDFETDLSVGAGRGSPFTVVFYAKLSGRSDTGIVSKFGDAMKSGWSIGLEWDSFGLDRIATSQQSDNKQNRTINGFPGLAGEGSDVRLGARDDKFHLYVVHLTGSGGSDGKVYFDGSEKSLSMRTWSFGRLSSGSVVNKGPLRIGAFNKNGFRGEIAFVEIWSGSRLQDGMTLAEYSKLRFNQGTPLRAKKR